MRRKAVNSKPAKMSVTGSHVYRIFQFMLSRLNVFLQASLGGLDVICASHSPKSATQIFECVLRLVGSSIDKCSPPVSEVASHPQALAQSVCAVQCMCYVCDFVHIQSFPFLKEDSNLKQ